MMKLSAILFTYELQFKKAVAVRFELQNKGCNVKVYSNYNETELEFWLNGFIPTLNDAEFYIEKYQQLVK